MNNGQKDAAKELALGGTAISITDHENPTKINNQDNQTLNSI